MSYSWLHLTVLKSPWKVHGLHCEVERIKEWLEKKKREDELVNLLTGEGPELPKPTSEAAP